MNYRKATVVSLVPFKITEWKPGIYPGYFEIPACQHDESPVLYYVGESVFHVDIDPDRSVTVKVTPEDVAKSLVTDYEVSCLGYNPVTNTGPGIFWIPGEQDLGMILKDYAKELKQQKERQHQWFIGLVKMGDDDWERIGRHQAISDIQRVAARKLNLERPWLIVSKEVGVDAFKCFACQTIVSNEAIVCPNCKCILNIDKYKELQFAKVGN